VFPPDGGNFSGGPHFGGYFLISTMTDAGKVVDANGNPGLTWRELKEDVDNLAELVFLRCCCCAQLVYNPALTREQVIDTFKYTLPGNLPLNFCSKVLCFFLNCVSMYRRRKTYSRYRRSTARGFFRRYRGRGDYLSVCRISRQKVERANS